MTITTVAPEVLSNTGLAYPTVTYDLMLAEEVENIDFDYQKFNNVATNAGLSRGQIEDLNIRYCTDETMSDIKDKDGKPLSGDSMGRMGLYYEGTCYIAIDRIKVNATLSCIELNDKNFSHLVSDYTIHEAGHYVEDVLFQRLDKLVVRTGSYLLSVAFGSNVNQRWLPHERFAYKFQDKHSGSGVVKASAAREDLED